ncbi:MAG: hypothetical protein GC189_13880 [Alphaproteobacteria bacterium]|nr:hypothetical protein [Alphaproteobacteria bacterium]
MDDDTTRIAARRVLRARRFRPIVVAEPRETKPKRPRTLAPMLALWAAAALAGGLGWALLSFEPAPVVPDAAAIPRPVAPAVRAEAAPPAIVVAPEPELAPGPLAVQPPAATPLAAPTAGAPIAVAGKPAPRVADQSRAEADGAITMPSDSENPSPGEGTTITSSSEAGES